MKYLVDPTLALFAGHSFAHQHAIVGAVALTFCALWIWATNSGPTQAA